MTCSTTNRCAAESGSSRCRPHALWTWSYGWGWLVHLMAAIVVLACGRANAALLPRVSMEEEYHGYNFRKEHGLPDDDVRDLLQSRDGSLWILTQGGLARYDGVNFTVYNRANTPDLQSDDPRVLAEDSYGSIWVGGRGLLLRMSAGRLRTVTLPEKGRFANVSAIYADSSRNVWIGGADAVARIADDGTTIFGPENGLFPIGRVTAIAEDSSRKLMVGTFGGLFTFEPKQQRFDQLQPHPHFTNQPAAVLSLKAAADGHLWGIFDQLNQAQTYYSQHPLVYMLDRGSWKVPVGASPTKFTLGHGRPFMLSTQRGDLWLPGEPNQLHRLRRGELQEIQLGLPLNRDVATCMVEDHEGGLWMGTLQTGLWHFRPHQMRSYSAPDALPHENAWAICEGLDGAVWIGTDGGLARYHSGIWTRWKTAQGLFRNSIRALAVDRVGTVWIGTGQGLNSWHDGALSGHTLPGDWFESKIRVVLPTPDGGLWVAGAAGLHHMTDGKWKKLTTADGLANNDVRALLEDPQGALWIGTFGGGLQRYARGRFTTYSPTNCAMNGFVWALHLDSNQSLWIGTELGLYRQRDGRIAAFGKAQGLPDNLVNSILEDNFGQLWIGHDHGVYRVQRAALDALAEGRKHTVHCISYTKADGLPSEETNGQKSYPPACKTRDGRLWFATTKGVVVIDPQSHQQSATPPPVVIESLRATGELIFSHSADESPTVSPQLQKSASAISTPQIFSSLHHRSASRLPPGSGRVVEFTYTATTFVDADRCRFKYRLLGLDDRWIDAGGRRQAFFTNLKPGNYRFQVIAANHQGVWNETGDAYAFGIAPYFHETWWFYLLSGVVVLSSVGALVGWRWRELQRMNQLERHAAVAVERSRIAQDLHDGLGADLTRLTALADLASAKESDSSRDHLLKLAQHSREAARGLKDLIWMANPANDTLDSFLDRLCLIAEEFLRDAHISCRFDVSPHLPQQILALEKRRHLLLIIREGLNNVVKHSKATEVWITVRWHRGNLELILHDNGRGFDAHGVKTGTLGLTGIRGRVEKLGGHFEIESVPGRGTRLIIRLMLPMNENA